jgi:hypothetical protein
MAELAVRDLEQHFPTFNSEVDFMLASMHNAGINSFYVLQVVDPETNEVRELPFRNASAMNKVKDMFAAPEIERLTRPDSWVVENAADDMINCRGMLGKMMRPNGAQLIQQEAADIAKKCANPTAETVYFLQPKTYTMRLVFTDKQAADALIDNTYDQMQEIQPTITASLGAVRKAAFHAEYIDKTSNMLAGRDMFYNLANARAVESAISHEIGRAMRELSRPAQGIAMLRSAHRLTSVFPNDEDRRARDRE